MQYVRMVCGVELERINVTVVLRIVALRNVKMQNW